MTTDPNRPRLSRVDFGAGALTAQVDYDTANACRMTLAITCKPTGAMFSPGAKALVETAYLRARSAITETSKCAALPQRVNFTITVVSATDCQDADPATVAAFVGSTRAGIRVVAPPRVAVDPGNPRRVTVIVETGADRVRAGVKVLSRAYDVAGQLLAKAGAEPTEVTLRVALVSTRPVAKLPAETVVTAEMPYPAASAVWAVRVESGRQPASIPRPPTAIAVSTASRPDSRPRARGFSSALADAGRFGYPRVELIGLMVSGRCWSPKRPRCQ